MRWKGAGNQEKTFFELHIEMFLAGTHCGQKQPENRNTVYFPC
jgi:hypothetical protein